MDGKFKKLTPELAKKWLETMPDYQRTKKDLWVAEYAKDMEEGRWNEKIGDRIRFNKKGQMIDGQHRCLAVIESGVSIMVEVIEGLDDSAYPFIDKGHVRTVSDSIGGKNANVRSAIAKALIALSNGTPNASILSGNTSKKSNPISRIEVAEVAKSKEVIISQLLECFMQLKNANNGRFSAVVATCLAAYALELHGSIENFYEFCADLNKPAQERPVICTMAREKSAGFNITKGKSKNTMMFAIFAIAYKNWASDITPKVIQTSVITKDVNAVALKRDWGLS